jgi:glycosyltransferase involved in cell wall biosynthesis
MYTPLVSVIISTHNRKDLVKEAVRSSVEQDYSRSEVIVVDDGSTDDTKSELSRMFGSRIHYVFQENGQKSRARNKGVIESGGELICFLDSDDILLPHALSARVECFLQNEGCQVSYGQSLREEKEKRLKASSADNNHPSGYILKEYIAHPFIRNNDFMIRRKDMLDFGMYREDLTHLEDFELLCRLTFSLRFYFCNTYISLIRDRGNRAHHDFKGKLTQGIKAEDYIFADRQLANVLSEEKSKLYGRAYLRLAKASMELKRPGEFRRYFKMARAVQPGQRSNFKFWRRWLFSWAESLFGADT